MNPYEYVCDLKISKVTPAQESIEKALLLLLEEKEFYDITVKEISEKAFVARSTFYAYYDTSDDCLVMIENRFLKGIIAINKSLKCSEKADYIDLSFFEETLKYIKDHQKMLYLLMVKRYDHRFISIWKDAIKYHLYDRISERISENNRDLALEMIASAAISAYQYWLKHPYDPDIDFVKCLIRRTIEAYTEW